MGEYEEDLRQREWVKWSEHRAFSETIDDAWQAWCGAWNLVMTRQNEALRQDGEELRALWEACRAASYEEAAAIIHRAGSLRPETHDVFAALQNGIGARAKLETRITDLKRQLAAVSEERDKWNQHRQAMVAMWNEAKRRGLVTQEQSDEIASSINGAGEAYTAIDRLEAELNKERFALRVMTGSFDELNRRLSVVRDVADGKHFCGDEYGD